MTKKVSVLMPVFNNAATLLQAVQSIQNQTYTNWELIICDDGSSDGSKQLEEQIANQDKRILCIANDVNRGTNKALNRCLQIASGDYIARMDGDDDCDPTRFEKQVAFLNENSEYDIVSSAMVLFDEHGEWGLVSNPEKPSGKQIVCGTAIFHAPVMMRRECVEKVHGYSEKRRTTRVEDVDLWIRLYTEGCRAYNMQEPLYRMRNDKNALNRRKFKYRVNSSVVRLGGCKSLKLDAISYVMAFKPVVNGLVPSRLRNVIRRIQRKQR